MNKTAGMTIFTFLTVFSLNVYAGSESLVVADFDSGKPVSNLGQPVEVWLKDKGTDDTQKSSLSFVADDAAGKAGGQSAKIEYDVDSPNPAYNGIRTKLNNFDAREYKSLRFFVKGQGKKIKVELINGKTQRPSPYVFDGVTDQWQEVVVPLADFWGIGDKSSIEAFVVVFADILNEPKTGTIYIDQVSFSKD